MKEARRLAILTVHQTKNHHMVLWPYQTTVKNYCIPTVLEQTGGLRAPGSSGEHGTMMTSGLRSEEITTLRGSLEETSDTSEQQRIARVAPEGSVQEILTGAQTEGLNHPTVTSITEDTIFVPSDTVSNTDFTLLKNGSAYANTNITLTGPGVQPPSDARGYTYSLTYNGTALYSRTIDSKSFHDLYYDDSWTSSPTSSRSTNSSRILAVLGTIPSTANFKRHICGQKSSRRGVTTFENIQGGIEANTTPITRITTIELERVAWFVIYHWRKNLGDAPTKN